MFKQLISPRLFDRTELQHRGSQGFDGIFGQELFK